MQHSETRILTTHTGSLPRPAELVRLYAGRLNGEPVDPASLDTLERTAVADSVRRQVEAGIDIVNDGEQQRESFVLYMRHRLTGLGGEGSRLGFSDLDRYPEFKRQAAEVAAARTAVRHHDHLPRVTGPIAHAGTRALEAECQVLSEALEPLAGRYVESFLTAPSPGLITTIVRNDHYAGFHDYLAAVRDAMRVEYQTIAAHGQVLQIDCPDLAMERHGAFRDRPLKEFLAFMEAVVDAINTATEGIPQDRIRLHVCWGNYEGPHDDDVPLPEILPVLAGLKVGALVMPFGNARHAHEFTSFRDVPLRDDQLLIAGVIDTLSNVVEHPRTIADRLVRIAQVLGDPARLMAGTDCGFDTSAGNGRVAPDVVWAKLAALSEGAALASRELF